MKGCPYMSHVIASLVLILSLQRTQAASPSYVIRENLKRPFVDVASADHDATCTATSADPAFLCEKAIDSNINTEYKVKSPDNSIDSSINITFAHTYLINAVKITQLQGATTQIQQIKISFDDGKGVHEYFNVTQNAASQAKPDIVTFCERLTKSIKLTIMYLYDGTTGHGYKSIEVTNTIASADKHCESITIDPSKSSPHIGVYDDTSTLSIIATEIHAILSTTSESSSPRYVLKFGASSNTKVILDRYGLPGADQAGAAEGLLAINANKWRMLGIDFTGEVIGVNIGSTVVLALNETGNKIRIKYVSFYNAGSTAAKVLYCNRKVNCYNEASYFWPLDKPTISDVITRKATITDISNIQPGPAANLVTSAAIILKDNKVTLGDFSNQCVSNPKLCPQGMTVALWYKINPTASGAQTLLSSDTNSPGLQIYFNADVIYGIIQDGSVKYSVQLPAKKNSWQHVAITWSAILGISMMVNFNSNIRGSTTVKVVSTDTNTLLTLGAKNDLTGSADASVSSLVIWYKVLELYQLQKLGLCEDLFSDVPHPKSTSVYRYVPFDLIKTSSDKGNTITQSLLNYNDGKSSSGGWQPLNSNGNEYIQFDFVIGRTVTKLGTQGGNLQNQWVTAFKMSYSLNGIQWQEYKINDTVYSFQANTESKNIVTHKFCPSIEARFIRLYPVSWSTSINMRVGVFYQREPFLIKGCYSSDTLALTNPIQHVSIDVMHPGYCVTSCAIKSFTYAGLTVGSRCYCFSTLPSLDVSQYKCNEPCSGNPAIMCGGQSHFSVYEVREFLNTNFGVTIPASVTLFENFKVTSSSHHYYSVDFGEDITLFTNKSEIEYFAMEEQSRKVASRTWIGRYGVPRKLHTTNTLDVAWAVKDTNITYKKINEAHVVSYINMTIYEGKDVSMTHSSAGQNEEYSLPDATVHSTSGDRVSQRISTSGPRNVDRIYLLVKNKFRTGILKAFSVEVASTGYLKVQIYRPVCKLPGEKSYCYSSGTCTSIVSKCSSSSSTPSCSPPKAFYIASSSCMSSGLQCNQPSGSIAEVLTSNYELVFEKQVYLITGAHVIYAKNSSVEPDFKVRQKDILGVTLPASTGAELYMGKSTKRIPYKTNLNMTLGHLFSTTGYNSDALDYAPIVRATYIEPSTFSLALNCSVGHYIDSFNLSNAVSFEIHQADYICTERIRNVTYEFLPYAALNKPFNITIYQHFGYNVTHLIEFNSTDTITSTFRRVDRNITLQHTFDVIGVYNVDFIVYNILSSFSKRCSVIVLEEIDQVIIHRSPPANHTSPTFISWTVVNGTDTHCNLTLGDGTMQRVETGTINGTRTFSFTKTYTSVGEYWVNISCGNPVSRAISSTMAIVEKPIPWINCFKYHANRDIEVNETIELRATSTKADCTNVLARFDFGDGKYAETRNYTIVDCSGFLCPPPYRYYQVPKNYSFWSIFNYNITLYNNVSSKTCSLYLQVHKPVYPITFSSLTATDANFSTPTAFMMNISSGNDFDCNWNFGNLVTRINGSGFNRLGQYVYYTYSSVGCFTVSVTCTNRLYTGSNTTQACVYHPITNLKLTAPAEHDIKSNCPISFKMDLGTAVSFNLTWTHLLTLQTSSVAITVIDPNKGGNTEVPISYFPTIGVYKVELSAINKVTSLVVKTQIVHVELPIVNFCTKRSHKYIQDGHNVDLHSAVDSGSNVTVFWDFKDGTNQTNFYEADTLKLTGDNVSHSYSVHGLYKVRSVASNPLGSKYTVTDIIVQYPVTNLSLETNSPQIIPLGTTTFSLRVPDNIHVPTDAKIDVDFESNGNYRGLAFGTNKLRQFTKSITTPGLYLVTIKVMNQISSQQFNTTIDVQREIKGLQIIPVHTGGDPGYGAPGRGANKNQFPREYPVRFNAITTDGSNISYYIDYGDGSESNVTQKDYSTHQYATKGHYTITVIANNSVSEMKVTVPISVLDSNLDLVFNSDCPTWFPFKTTFQVDLAQVGNDACCLIDLTDGTSYIYKDNPSTICRSDWAALSLEQKIFPKKHNISITFPHFFKKLKYYLTKTSCHNAVSYLEKFHWAILVPLSCAFPIIQIKDIGQTYNKPTRYFRSRSIKVFSDVNVRCYASRRTEFNWTIHNINSTGHVNGIVAMPENSTANRSILELPYLSLPYGSYKFVLNVSVVSLTLVDASRHGYVHIIPSPLQCFVKDGNGWSQSVQRELVIDSQHSFDPDERNDNRNFGMKYYLYCKKNDVNYTFPEDPLTDKAEQAKGEGGCLTRQGGFVSKNISVKKFQNGTFKVNDTLQFRLYCAKGSRLEHFDVLVKMTDIDPPQCLLSTDDFTINRRIVTSSKLTIKSKCNIKGASESDIIVKWSLYKQNNLSHLEAQNLKHFLQSPSDRQDLVLRKDSLNGCSSYRVDLEARLPNRTPGNTWLLINTHCPPEGGSCEATPKEGEPKTLFTLRCENWTNFEGNDELKYYYYYKRKPFDLPLLFFHTEQTIVTNVTLPEGHEAFGYQVEIQVLLVDSVGAITKDIFKVKVKPEANPSIDSPCKTLRKEVLDKNGNLVNLEMNDNSQHLNQWCLRQAELLNKEANERVKTLKNLTFTLNETQTHLSELLKKEPQRTDYPEAAEVKVLKEQIEATNLQSKNCCQIRERFATSMGNVQLDSITTIQMTSATIFALTGNPEEQCIQALIRLTDALKKIMDFFLVETTSLNFDDVRSGMASFSQAAAGILYGFSVVLEKATRGATTMDGQNANLALFYSNYVQVLIRNTTNIIKSCCIVVNEFPTEIFTPELNITFSENTLDMVSNLSLYTGSGEVKIPGTWISDVFGDTNYTSLLVVSEATVFQENPFTADNSSKLVHSMVCEFGLSNSSGEIKLQNLTNPIELWIHKKGSLSNCFQGTLSHRQTKYHIFVVSRNESSINVDVREVLRRGQTSAQPEFSISLRKGQRPDDHDHWYDLPGLDGNNQTFYTQFYSSEETNNTMFGEYFVAVRYNRSLNGLDISQENGNKELNYSLCMYTSECIYWDTTLDIWTGYGCQAGPGSNLTHTQCLCNHATTFGSDFVVPPNKIDWDKVNLSELLNNFLVAGVLLSTIGLYLLLLIPARRQDLKDLEKLGVIPIPSNDPRDTYGYEVCFYTGFQGGNGTTAQVSIILSGSKDSTQPRVLQDIDGTHKLFKRGAEDSFLVTTPYDLGQLASVRIWHNFGGDSPSWFLSRMYIRDLQTDTKTWYVCNRWFAVEEDDGKIDRILHPASNRELTSFNLLFQTETRKNFSDSHIWFSVYYRPPQSTFTRVQRMTCCLCVLLSTMLANAMFYQTGGETPNAEVVIGPFRLSTQQISIAITSSLVVLPINLLIMNLFRKARSKNPPVEEKTTKFMTKDRKTSDSGTEHTSDDNEETDHTYETISVVNESQVSKASEKTEDDIEKEEISEPKKPFTLPYWCIYIAYVLAFLTCAASTVFTIFYSLTFGKEKSEGWLSAIMISFWQDVLISQPLKVLGIAMIIALLIKDPSKVDDGTKRSAELGHDEEWIHREPEGNNKVRLQNFVPKPPTEEMLYESRQILIRQKEMKAIIKEIVVYFTYLMVLCTVAYGGFDPQSYRISEATKEMFSDSSYAGGDSFESISEPVNFWKWLHSTVIPTLKPTYWYGPYNNNEEQVLWTEDHIKRKSRRGWKVKIHKRVSGKTQVEGQAAFDNTSVHKFPTNVIADRGTAYIVGSARLRQLRVKQGDCSILPALQGHTYSCSSPYTWEKEDEGTYLPGWQAVNNSVAEGLAKDEKSSWVWKSAWDLQGSPYWGRFATYWGGGYVANVDPSRLQTIEEMQSLELDIWIDRYTRAVFTEFALYNAYTNFFCVITMLSEILPTGGYNPYVQFRPIRLYRYTGPETYVLMAFELVYIIFLFMFTYSEFKELFRRKKKYFEDPWNYLEMLVIVLSFTAIGLFFARLLFGNFAVQRMKEHPRSFISFTYVLLLDECHTATLGYAVFFAILKSLRLLRFNRRLSLLTRTVKECAAPLLSFFFMFMIVFFAYVQFAFVVFGPDEKSYSSFSTCISTMMSMTLGGFDFQTLMNVNRVLGPMFFFSYILFVFMILVNVFVSIINDTMAEVKSDVDLQPNDYEIMDFVVYQIKIAAGVRVGSVVKPLYKDSKSKFQLEVEKVESLSENIEYALVNTIVEDQRQTNWLKRENMTKKKLILLREVLRREEDYDEDDLANFIPLMEQFLIKHSDLEVAKIVLGRDDVDGTSLDDVKVHFSDSSETSSQYQSLRRMSQLYKKPTRNAAFENLAYDNYCQSTTNPLYINSDLDSSSDSDDDNNEQGKLEDGETCDGEDAEEFNGKLVDGENADEKSSEAGIDEEKESNTNEYENDDNADEKSSEAGIDEEEESSTNEYEYLTLPKESSPAELSEQATTLSICESSISDDDDSISTFE